MKAHTADLQTLQQLLRGRDLLHSENKAGFPLQQINLLPNWTAETHGSAS